MFNDWPVMLFPRGLIIKHSLENKYFKLWVSTGAVSETPLFSLSQLYNDRVV